jgi:DNA-binding winged helix-turn-helix (wHTH) protein/Tol biopolymer transport system component
VTERQYLVFNFEDIEVREREFLLIKGGERLPVEPTAFRVLLFLIRNPSRLVSKDEIVASVWNEVAVSDNSVTRAIAQLRRVLDDDPREPRYILTVPTLGYRFLCEVAAREDRFSSSVAAESTPLNEERRTAKDAPEEARGPQLTPLESPTGTTEHKRPGQRPRKLLLAGAAVAVLLLLAAGFVLRRFIGAHAANPANPPQLATEQRLTANPSEVPVSHAVISPDGKYVAYADPTGLYLRQISSGETRPWSLPKGFVALPESSFPDGTHLLVRRIPEQPLDYGLFGPLNSSLYKLSMLGGEPQEMMKDAKAGYVSPDGSRIAYLPTPNVNEMWMIDSDGANPRKVVSSGETKKAGIFENWIQSAAWSPTGQHLAYIESHFVSGPVLIEDVHSLKIVGPNGEAATVVVDDPRIGEALWWAPDGRILFSYREDPASRQNHYGVYSIRVDERTGKAAGPPQPVTQAEGSIGSMSGTADGKRLVVWRRTVAPQVFIASFDTALHRWNEPRRLTLDANVNLATAWTADSKAVLFVSNRNGTWKLYKQAIEETTPEVLAEGRSITLPRLSADGSHVLYLSSSNPEDVSFPASLMSKPLAGGAPRVVIQGKGLGVHQCAEAPSTLCIYSQIDGQDVVFRSFDLEHGAGRELLRIPNKRPNWTLSADGSKLALFLDPHRIRFFSVATGAAHDVTVKDWPVHGGDWGTSGQTVFVASQAPNGVPVILEVDQTGKAKVVLQGSSNISFGFMIQSPDGRYGLVAEATPSDSNAWIVKDF